MKAGMAWEETGGVFGEGEVGWIDALVASLPYFWVLKWTDTTFLFLVVGLCFWAVLMGTTFKSMGKFRYGDEHGTAEWGNVKELRKKWEQEGIKKNSDGTLEVDPNIILSQNMRLGISNTGKTRKNKNILIIGGSGTRKSTGLVMPNIMQCNSSFIVTDPSGELYAGTGHLLEERGYVVKCLNLVNMDRSHRMNPFHYITKPEHVATMATNFIENTKDKNKSGGDPFWDEAMKLLLMSLIAYLWETVPEENQNFDTLTQLVRMGKLDSDEMNATSDLDRLFENIGQRAETSLAWRNYLLYMQAPPKTRASVVITLAAKLGVFNIPAVSELTRHDELELDKMGDRKQALFCIIPQAETTFNFLVGLVYTSLFSALYKRGEERAQEPDSKGKNFLKVPVQVLMDEFANVAVPDSFEQILATCRKYDISIDIFLQNMTQLKKLYEKDWESIAGNCDSLIYLGGNESFTWKYISEALDKETIKIKTAGKSGENFSENEQVTGRELMTKGEVRGLPDDKCIVMVRGEYGVVDDKFNITKHPNFKKIAMGGAKPYSQTFISISEEERLFLDACRKEHLEMRMPLQPGKTVEETVHNGNLTQMQQDRLEAAKRMARVIEEYQQNNGIPAA